MKQVEQQRAERARYVVDKAEQEQLADVIEAQGEAKAAELIQESLKRYGAAYIELKKIDAAIEVAQSLARNRNVTYLPAQGNNMLLNPTI
eukprot:Pgem_evm1s783